MQLLFALRMRALRVLEAGLASELQDALLALRTGWHGLAQDLALGRVSPQPGLPEDTRGRLQALLAPDATRAAEVRAECARSFEGIVQRLWPQLEVVVVGTAYSTEQHYCDALRQADCKGLPFYCPFYQASGGECPPRPVPWMRGGSNPFCPRRCGCISVPHPSLERPACSPETALSRHRPKGSPLEGERCYAGRDRRVWGGSH